MIKCIQFLITEFLSDIVW